MGSKLIRWIKEHQRNFEAAANAPSVYKNKLRELTEYDWDGEYYETEMPFPPGVCTLPSPLGIRYVMQLENADAADLVCDVLNKAFLNHKEDAAFISIAGGRVVIDREVARKVLSRDSSVECQQRLLNLAEKIKAVEIEGGAKMESAMGQKPHFEPPAWDNH